jgi:hypothetical protein
MVRYNLRRKAFPKLPPRVEYERTEFRRAIRKPPHLIDQLQSEITVAQAKVSGDTGSCRANPALSIFVTIVEGRGRRILRITIAHRKTKAEAVRAVDQAMTDVFSALATGPLTVTTPQKNWNGSVMNFSLTAQMGFLKNPITGTVTVTDKDITIDADLGFLSRLMPEEKVRTTVESRVRGLLT